MGPSYEEVMTRRGCGLFRGADLRSLSSSARDQLTNQAVAVKKIMKPFSTPVLAKRTYRELKLLKHLRHENVGS
jgi:p38 MAP kinase